MREDEPAFHVRRDGLTLTGTKSNTIYEGHVPPLKHYDNVTVFYRNDETGDTYENKLFRTSPLFPAIINFMREHGYVFDENRSQITIATRVGYDAMISSLSSDLDAGIPSDWE